jgi:hypothetical protein
MWSRQTLAYFRQLLVSQAQCLPVVEVVQKRSRGSILLAVGQTLHFLDGFPQQLRHAKTLPQIAVKRSPSKERERRSPRCSSMPKEPVKPQKPPAEEPGKPAPVESPPAPQPNEDRPLVDPVPPDGDRVRM